MLARLALVASLVLGGCSGKSDAPAAGTSEKLGFPFVSDAIANRLGDANVIIAINLGGFGLGRYTAALPDMLGCAKELIGKLDIAVIGASDDGGQGFVTGLPEEATKKCIATFAPLLGAQVDDKPGAYHLAIAGDTYQMVWKDGLLSVTDVAHPAKLGPPGDRMRKLVAEVPKDAEAWIVSGGFPKYKITKSVAWLTTNAQTIHLVVTGDSNEPGVAKAWVSGIVTGFKQAAAKKGITVDDKWFTVTETGTAARLEGDIPKNIFERPAEAP